MKDFYLRVEPEDFATMKTGLAYELIATGSGDDRWAVRPGVRITRPPTPSPSIR